ncbi:hypothetical protein CKO25_14705 [Thiocapsa imhoffii]|uniref:Uncharacterized protein n=1 Tax=Thiocapsa imhoffii TaxID=382777 RepID=A0A9X1B9E6_9GAMM|nr:hypothetical protein [Thiocapsa imhoffii]MBK1645874.1 hypothetical protein [Thiocapsa imhoffii]
MTRNVNDVPGHDDAGDNPVRDLLVDCDRAPREGLAWIDRMGEELKFTPLVMFARFIALRHLAIDVFQSAGVTELGGAREADIVRIMDEESRDHADAALT